MKTRQKGVTLIVALIMLVLLTLLTITGFNIGKGSFQAVTNMQQRNEGQAGAKDVLERAISNTRFMDAPEAIFVEACHDSNNRQCIDINGDKKAVVTVNVVSKCVKAQRKTVVDPNNDDEKACVLGVDPTLLAMGQAPPNSSCFDTLWEVQATAIEPATNASTQVTQGIRVMTGQDNVATSCP